MALFLAHRTGEHAANLGPDPVVVKPIMPGPDGLPGAKILRQVAPSAASLVQIQTGVDHLAHIRRQRLVNRKMWRNCLPLGIRQIAWIAPTVILVAFAMLRRPHGMLLLVHQQRTTGGSGRSLISRSVKQALRACLAGLGIKPWSSATNGPASRLRRVTVHVHRTTATHQLKLCEPR